MKRQLVALSVLTVVSAPSLALAAARVVVIPVVVGAGPEPAPELMSGLAQGLRENKQWNVEEPSALGGLLLPAGDAKDEDLTAYSARIDDAAAKIAAAPGEAAGALEAVRTELRTRAATQVPAKGADDLVFRASALLVGALTAAKQDERAKTVAAETALLFPGRKGADVAGLSPEAVALLAMPPATGVKTTIQTRPAGCEVELNGASVGRAPVGLPLLAGGTYWARAVCPPPAGATAPLRSHAQRLSIDAKDTTRTELLDAEFERALLAEGAARIRFASADERRDLEPTYARRLAERLGAEIVVLASLGELSGADWMHGRLYLKSGYLNRQALIRLEASRAVSLGRYLATGREIPHVLRPEEAGQLVAAGQAVESTPPVPSAWYTDYLGWALVGAGSATAAVGLWARSVGKGKREQGDKIRGDSLRQQSLYRTGEKWNFYGDVGTVGGGLMLLTGVVLLVVPQYDQEGGELFAVTPLRDGGLFSWSGRF